MIITWKSFTCLVYVFVDHMTMKVSMPTFVSLALLSKRTVAGFVFTFFSFLL